MKKWIKRLVGTGLCVFVPICVRGFTDDHLAVADHVATNHLETWEGRYSVSEIVTAATNSIGASLHFAIYRHVRKNESPGWYDGILAEVYQYQTGAVVKLTHADTNIKGVTPVLQRIGVSTNYPFAAYWMLWRHPGNGGLQKYTEYAFTNNCFSLVRHLEFGDVKPNRHWYLVENEDAYGGSISPVVNNFRWYDNETIWENTNTIYRSYIGYP